MLLVWLICFYMGLNVSVILGQDKKIVVKRVIKNNGFHRELETEFQVPLQWVNDAEKPESIQLIESIPSGMYVDLDQTNSLQRFHGHPKVISAERIDVEQPEHLSKEHLLHVFPYYRVLKSVVGVKYTLPIHLRYHKPSLDNHIASVVLKPPIVLIASTEDDGRTGKWRAPCNSKNNSLCSWENLPVIGLKPLTMTVPVGHLEQRELVVCVTSAVIFLGVLVIIATALIVDKRVKQEMVTKKKD